MAEREVKIVITGEDRSKKALKAGEKSWRRFGKNITGFVGGAAKALLKLGAAAAVGIGAIGVTSIKTAIEVESAFAGIIKTTDGLVDQFGNLNFAGEQLREEFRQLALAIPTDLPDLMQVGELGGQLGIAREHLVSFTRTIAAMGEATNLTREEAATAFAQIANIMGTAQTDFDRMGSSIVALGNSFATTERDIVSFAQRIAATGRIAGLTEADIFGIATAFSSVGIQAEAGGTAVQKVLTEMVRAVATGGKSLEEFARVSGLSAEEFAAAFEVDAAGAFTAFVEGLGEEGDDAFKTLAALELMDQRLIRAFLSLASAGDLLGETIAESNLAWDENTALSKEAEARYRTFEKQLALVKNVVKDVALSFGDALIPFLREALVAAMPFIREFAARLPELLETKVIPAIKNVIGVIVEIVKAIKEGDFGRVAEIMGGHLRTMYSKALTWVEDNIGPLVDAAAAFLTVWVSDWVAWIKENIGPFAASLGEQIRDWIAAATTWVKDNIEPLKEKIGETLKAWAAVAVEWFKDNVVPKVAAFGEQIRDWIAGAVAWVKDNWGLLREKAIVLFKVLEINATRWFKETVVPKVAALGGQIRDWIAGAVAWVTENWGIAKTAIGTAISTWADEWVAWFKANKETIKEDLGKQIRDWINAATKWFEDNWEPTKTAIGTALDKWADEWVAWFKANKGTSAETLGGILSELITEAISRAEETFPEHSVTFGEKIREMIRGAGEFLIENLPDMAAALGTAIGKILRGAIGLFAGSMTFTQMRDEMFFNIWKGIITGSAEDEALITSGFNALVDAIKGMWDAFIIAVTGDPDYKQTLVDWWHGLLTDALEFVLTLPVPWTDIGRDMIAGIIQGIEDKWKDLKKELEDRIKKLPPLVRKILGAESPSRVFAEIGLDMMIGLGEGITEGEAQVIKKLTKAIGRIVNAFAQLVELQQQFGQAGGQLPDIGAFLDQFELTIRTLFWRIEGLIEEFGEKRIKRVRKSAKRLREIIDAVMIDMGGIALADLPDMGMWRDQIIDLTRAVIQALGHLAFEFGEKGLESAAVWAKSVREILGIVKPAIDALAAMTELQTVENMALAAALFATQLMSLVKEFVRVKDIYAITFADDAKAWWDNVKAIIGIIKPGVDALIAMQELVIVENMALVAALFANQLMSLVKEFERVKNVYAIQFAEDAKEWWSNVKAIIDIIGPGVQALIDMQELQIVTNMPLVARIFGEQLVSLVNEFERVKDIYAIEFSENAKEWWAAVKEVLSVVEPGITALKALLEWEDAIRLPTAAEAFARALFDVVEELEEVASEYDVTFTEEALKFFDAVKKAISIIAPGVKALEKLGEFVAVQELLTQMDIFKGQMKLVIDKMIELAEAYDTDALEAVQRFGEAVEEIFKGVKVALEALKKMLKLPETGELGIASAIDFFEGVLNDTVRRLGLIADNMEENGLDKARKFHAVAVQIRTAVLAGINAIMVLGEAGVPALSLVSGALASMLDAIIDAVRNRLTNFFDIGFAMGRSLASGIISGLSSGLANANVSGMIPTTAAQHGFSGVVTRPTLFLAGEAGPESVNITPGGGAQGGINIEQLIVQGSGSAAADVANTIRMLEFGTVAL